MSALDGLLTLNTSVHTLMFHNVMEDYTTEEEMEKKTQKVFTFLKALQNVMVLWNKTTSSTSLFSKETLRQYVSVGHCCMYHT